MKSLTIDEELKLEYRYEKAAEKLEKAGYQGIDVSPDTALYEYSFLIREVQEEGQEEKEFQAVICTADIYNNWPWKEESKIFHFTRFYESDILESWEEGQDKILNQYSQEVQEEVKAWPVIRKLEELEVYQGYISQEAYTARWKYNLRDLEEGRPSCFFE